MVLLTMFLVVFWITCSTPQPFWIGLKLAFCYCSGSYVEVCKSHHINHTMTKLKCSTTTRWWFETCFHFHPYLGKIPILTNFFQRRWFKHQLDNHSNHSLNDVMHPTYGLYRGGQRSWKLCLCLGSTWSGWYFIVPGQSQTTSYKLWWLFGELSESYKLWLFI